MAMAKWHFRRVYTTSHTHNWFGNWQWQQTRRQAIYLADCVCRIQNVEFYHLSCALGCRHPSTAVCLFVVRIPRGAKWIYIRWISSTTATTTTAATMAPRKYLGSFTQSPTIIGTSHLSCSNLTKTYDTVHKLLREEGSSRWKAQGRERRV